MDGKLIVSSSPHISSPVKTKNIMLDVIIALIPSLIASIYFFGPRAAVVVIASVATCVIAEYICRKVMKREQTIGDLSAVVTGILLAFNYPVGLPLWIAAIGGVVAIVMVKQMFGGLGHNFDYSTYHFNDIFRSAYDNMGCSICLERYRRCNIYSNSTGTDGFRKHRSASYIFTDVPR